MHCYPYLDSTETPLVDPTVEDSKAFIRQYLSVDPNDEKIPYLRNHEQSTQDDLFSFEINT